MKRAMGVLALSLLVGCSNSNNEADSLCGAGEEISAGGARACLYQSALIEEGFVCPADVSIEIALEGGGVLCTDQDVPPVEIVDELIERGEQRRDGTPWIQDDNNDTTNNMMSTNNVSTNNNASSNNSTNNTTVDPMAAWSPHLNWFLDTCENFPPLGLDPADDAAHFSSVLRDTSTEAYRAELLAVCSRTRPPHSIQDVSLISSAGEPVGLSAELINADGAMIHLELDFSGGDDLIANATTGYQNLGQTAQQPDEIFLTIQGRQAPSRLMGLTVELLDPASGDAFDPPVSRVTDEYGFVRLTLPEDPAQPGNPVENVAVHVIAEDGYSNYFYSAPGAARFAPGGGAILQVLSEAVVGPYYLDPAGQTQDPTTGWVAHVTEWTHGPSEWTAFGCAASNETPPSPTVIYGRGGPWRPPIDGARSETDPRWSATYHFGLPDGPTTFEHTDGVTTATITVPRIVPNARTTVYSWLSQNMSATNPTASACYSPAVQEPGGCANEATAISRLQSLVDNVALRFENNTSAGRSVSLLSPYELWPPDPSAGHSRPNTWYVPPGEHLSFDTSVDQLFGLYDENGDCLDVFRTSEGSALIVAD